MIYQFAWLDVFTWIIWYIIRPLLWAFLIAWLQKKYYDPWMREHYGDLIEN